MTVDTGILLHRLAKGDDEWFVYDTIMCSFCGGDKHYEDHVPHDEDPPTTLAGGFDHALHCAIPEILAYLAQTPSPRPSYHELVTTITELRRTGTDDAVPDEEFDQAWDKTMELARKLEETA